MSKEVICENCHSIGAFGDDKMLYDIPCPVCGGKLLRVHHEDFYLLQYRSGVKMMPGHWNASYEKTRWEEIEKKGIVGKMPKFRIIKDVHPCEKCRWFGTYCPEKNKSKEMELGGEQKMLEVSS